MQLLELSWPEVAELPRTIPVVIPIAALEQHGHHLPLFTDSLLLGEIVRRTDLRLRDRLLFTPLQWLGNSEHHLDFPGTMTATPRGYLDLLTSMVENFLFHGFTRVVFLNGHGGNIVPAHQAIFELRQKHRHRSDLLLLATTYWSLGTRPQDAGIDTVQPHMGHACEWETSMILRLRPELVRDYRAAIQVTLEEPFSPASRGWITKDRSESGHIGDPRGATVAKGEALFEVFTGDVARFLTRVADWDGGASVTS